MIHLTHSIQHRFPLIKAAILLLMTCVIGCFGEDPIVRYEIPKGRSGLEHLREAAGMMGEASAERPAESKEQDRMIVALAMRDDATWFFKINGPVSRVTETEEQWRPFLESVSFDEAGQPVWELPDDWKAAGPKPMRFATLVIDQQEPPIELAISNLSAGQDLLMNVNRWRGQLGLEPTTDSELKDSLTSIQAGEEELTLFDATGKMSGSMMPPFAGGRANALNAGSAGSKISFTAPEGWKPGQPSPFLKARFTQTDGDKSAQISVSSLPAAANEWLPNVIRWAGQLGMSSLGETELDELTESITVDGQAGKLVRLVPEEKEADKATIAAMVKKGSNAWFFKLTGDREMVKESDQVLIDFLKTVKLP